MRSSTLAATLVVLIGCVLFSQDVKGQNVWGYSSISYDHAAHRVTATSTTELDYSVQEYYKARVNSLIMDENNTLIASGFATDNIQAGYVSITLQRLNATAEEFQVTGTHFGIAILSDYVTGSLRYRDFYDYTSLADFAYDYYSSYAFLGRGPERRTTNSIYQVGKTHSYAQTAVTHADLTPKTSGTIVPPPENEDYNSEVSRAGQTSLARSRWAKVEPTWRAGHIRLR